MHIRLTQCLVIICLCFTLATAQTAPAGQQRPLQGFDGNSGDRERALEKQFDSFLKKDEVADTCGRQPAVLGNAAARKKPYSVNTPLTTSNFRIRANPSIQKTLINTVDAYVFCFQTRFNFVAVGTPITRRPPRRSVRAALPHTAPTLDNGGKKSSPHITQSVGHANSRAVSGAC